LHSYFKCEACSRIFDFAVNIDDFMLFENTARAIGEAPEEVKLRHIGNCMKTDPAYGKGVADALGISI